MTVVAYGVDHGVDRLLNVVKGYGKPPTPPSFAKISPNEPFESYARALLNIRVYHKKAFPCTCGQNDLHLLVISGNTEGLGIAFCRVYSCP